MRQMEREGESVRERWRGRERGVRGDEGTRARRVSVTERERDYRRKRSDGVRLRDVESERERAWLEERGDRVKN